MSSEHKTDSRSGGVEVVADQGDDGSFEIRLERQPDVETGPTPADERRAATWHAQPAPVRSSSKRTPWVIGGSVVAAMLLLAFFVLAQSTGPWGQSRPQTVEINDQPRFRGYVIAGEEPERVRNVRLDVAEEAPAADDLEEEYDEDRYDDAFEDDPPDDNDDAGPPRIELRSAASGGSQVPEGLTDAERRRFFKKQREERAQQKLREFLEEQDLGRARTKTDTQEAPEDDDFDEYYDEELDEDAYYDEYDEYDDEYDFDDEDEAYDPR